MSDKKHFNLSVTEDNGKSLTTTNVSTEYPEEIQRIIALAGIKNQAADCGCGSEETIVIDSDRMMEAVDIYGNQMPEPNGSVNDEDREENEVEDDDDREVDEPEEEDHEEPEELYAQDEDPSDNDEDEDEYEFSGSGPQEGDLEDYSKKTANSISRQKKHLVPGGDNALSYSESVEEIEAALIAEAKKFEEACSSKKKMKEEEEVEEGNEFTDKMRKAKAAGKKEFKVGDKTYPVKESEELEESDEKCDKCDCSPCECDKVEENTHLAYLKKLSGL